MLSFNGSGVVGLKFLFKLKRNFINPSFILDFFLISHYYNHNIPQADHS